MKGFVGIFLIILASACLQVGYGKEMCSAHNCLKPEACQGISKLTCSNGLSCCYYVRTEYRTLCRQWGGECMSSCAPRVQIAREKATDCASNQVCCVLV